MHNAYFTKQDFEWRHQIDGTLRIMLKNGHSRDDILNMCFEYRLNYWQERGYDIEPLRFNLNSVHEESFDSNDEEENRNNHGIFLSGAFGGLFVFQKKVESIVVSSHSRPMGGHLIPVNKNQTRDTVLRSAKEHFKNWHADATDVLACLMGKTKISNGLNISTFADLVDFCGVKTSNGTVQAQYKDR